MQTKYLTAHSTHFLPHTDLHKLLPPHAPLALQIKLLDHSNQLLLLQPLPQLPRHPPKVLQADHALALGVEQRERPEYLGARIALRDQRRRYVLEGREREE